ncbi:hypothetical protein OG432_30385 [Streptomyces sp. NBC_00442]|uniref:hypothetical protein n=1 Tax=Streptomyces sp. NBC_00442 TaxID=2903651 RepID=UPI002E1C42A2
MPKQLTTQNASITTVAVEVQALTISGKQVTLSVFRQLREESLISSDGTLNGVPWGYVNYHPDRCSDSPPHWHIVWQDGGELRRSRVLHEPRWTPLSGAESDQLLNAQILSWATDPQSTDRECPLQRRNGDQAYPCFVEPHRRTHLPTGVSFVDEPSPAAVEVAATTMRIRHYRALATKSPAPDFQLRSAESAEGSERYRTALAQLQEQVDGYGRTLDELTEDVSLLAIEEATRRQRHRLVRAALAQLPQLFIAV